MATEILDVVDTAVKIGLGALISGVATYFVTKLKHTEEAAQTYDRRKWEIIEKSLDAANGYRFALGDLFSALDGLRMDYPDARTIEEIGETNFIEKHDLALLNTAPKRLQAFSLLRIIGETKAADILYGLHELEDEIRLCVVFKNELPSSKKLQDWYNRLRMAGEAFINEISKCH